MQLADALSLYLSQSALYTVLSNLPPPDPTNPTSSTTFQAQQAIQDSLPILEEIVLLYETDEVELFSQEVEKRRKRLGAPSPDTIRKEVGQENWGKSRVSKAKVMNS
jgi:superkiller protein 3